LRAARKSDTAQRTASELADLAARYRDPSRDVGNLAPGEELFRPEPVTEIPMNPWSADDLIAAHRQRNAMHTAATPKPGPFRHSINRRG
jgi:hypothetical protein